MAESSGSFASRTSLAARLTALKGAAFQALLVMQRSSHGPNALSIVGAIVKWLQMMAFLFISSDFGWDKNVIAPIKVVALVPSPAGWFKVLSPIFLNVLFFVSFVWVLLFCSLTIWTLRSFLRGSIPSLAPLKLLASVGQFSATVAYIPLLTLLLSVYMCGDNASGVVDQWAGQYSCMQSGHLALVVLSTIGGATFSLLASLFALVFFDSHPLSGSLAAKVHGRAELILIVVKTVLIITLEIFPEQIGSAWALVGINLAAAVVWVAAYLYYMPMTHHGMNCMQLSLSCTYLWGGVCLVIQQAAPWVNAAVVLYTGAPMAMAAGVVLANARRSSVMSCSTAKLRSVYEVEMKARYVLQQALREVLHHAKVQSNGSNQETAVLLMDGPGDDAASLPATTPKAGYTARFDRGPIESPRSITGPWAKGGKRQMRDKSGRRSVVGGGMGAEAADAELWSASYMASDTESRERMIGERMPLRTLAEVETMYKHGAQRFPTSAMLHMMESRFYAVFRHDRQLATSHLLLSNRLHPALDVAYMAFQARRAAETATGTGALSSAMHRVSFDKHLADAKAQTLKAAQAQLSFWAELCDPCPDINSLHSIATDMAVSTTMAEEHFREVFALHPQSVSAMRLFAQYNLSVVNNAEKATAISAEADRIEDQKNKEANSGQGSSNANKSTGFPLLEEMPVENLSDAVAQLTVGATSRDLGVILSANAAACKILGYTRLQLERRNVSILVPEPFAESHDMYMRRYLSTGEGKLIESARTTLGKHRLGHLVPMAMLVREAALPDGTPVFSATLRPHSFNDHIVLMDEDWVLLGASAGALVALQVDAAIVQTTEICMADYCPMLNIAEKVDDLMGRAQGSVVSMILPGVASAPVSFRESSSGRNSLGGAAALARQTTSPGTNRSGGAFLAGSEGAAWDPSQHHPVEVKASLATQTCKGHVINVLTFRLLTANETAQRTAASAIRRASMAGGIGMGMSMGRSGVGMSVVKTRPTISFQASLVCRGEEADAASATGQDRAHGDDDGQSSEGDRDREVSGDAEPEVSLTPALTVEIPDGHPGLTAADLVGGSASCPVMRPKVQVPSIRTGEAPAPAAAPASAMKQQHSTGRVGSGRLQRHGTPGTTGSWPGHSHAGPGQDGPGKRPEADTPLGAATLSQQWNPMHENSARKDEDGQGSDDVRVDMTMGKGKLDQALDKKPLQQTERRPSVAGGSVRSAGSGSKRSFVGRGTMNKLRRLLSDAQKTTDRNSVPGLSALYMTGWVLLALNVALAAMTAVLLDRNFVAYATNLKYASLSSVATQNQIRAFRLVLQRVAYNRGWTTSSPAAEAKFSAEMVSVGSAFSDAIARAHQLTEGTDASSYFTAPELAYHDFSDWNVYPKDEADEEHIQAMMDGNKYWPVTLSDGSVVVGVLRQTTLLSFASMWAGTLRQISSQPCTSVTADEPAVIFFLANSQMGAPAYEYVKQAIYHSYLASQGSQQDVTTLVWWLFITFGPILGMILLLTVVPILLYVDRKRDDIMEGFLDLPTLVVLYLRAGAERRLRALRSNDGDGDDEVMEDEEDEEETRRALQLGVGPDVPDIDEDGTSMDWDWVFARVRVEANRAEKKKLQAAMKGTQAGATVPRIDTAAPATTKPVPRSVFTACCRRQAPVASQSARKGDVARSYCSGWCGQRPSNRSHQRTIVNPDGTVTTISRRDFRKSSKSLLSLSVFLIPVLLMLVAYLALYLETMNVLEDILSMSSFTSLSAIRAVTTRGVINSLYQYISNPGITAPEHAFRYEHVCEQFVSLDAANSLLVYDVHVGAQDGVDGGISPPVVYDKGPGTEITTVHGMPPERMAAIRRAQDSDACPILASVVPSIAVTNAINLTECRAFSGGVLTSGLQAGVKDFITRGRRLRERRKAASVPIGSTDGRGNMTRSATMSWDSLAISNSTSSNSTGISVTMPWSVTDELGSDDWRTIDVMARTYFAPTFTYVGAWYSEAGDALVQNYRMFLMAFIGGFLAVYTVATLVVFLPSISALAKDVQSKRAMLLMLPVPVIVQTPSLRAMVLQIVAEHEGAGAAHVAQPSASRPGSVLDGSMPGGLKRTDSVRGL